MKIRFDDFRTVTRDTTLEQPTDNVEAIRRAARHCLKRVPFDRRLRLLGVKIGSLMRASEVARVSATERAGSAEWQSLKLFD